MILLLLGIERLLRILHRCLGGSHAGLILLYGKLGLADFDAHPIFGLLQSHLALPVFQFTADLERLSGAVAQRDVELQAHALIGSRGVDELIEGRTVACARHERRLSQGGIGRGGGAKPLGGVLTDIRRILGAAQPRAAIIGEGIEGRQHSAAQSLVAEVLAAQLDARLDEFWPMAESIVDEVLGRLNLLIFRNFHGGRRNHVGSGESGIMKGPAERVLHDQLLQLKVGLGHRQSLLVRSHGAFRAHRFNRRQTADFDLFLRVGQCLLGECQRFFFHSLIFVGVDKIPIHILDLIHGGDDLQPESHV